MKLDRIRTIEEIFTRFTEKHFEEGHRLSIKFFVDGQEINKVIVNIKSMETINVYDLVVDCLDINDELVRFSFNRKSEKNENEKMKNLTIDRIKDEEIIYNEYKLENT